MVTWTVASNVVGQPRICGTGAENIPGYGKSVRLNIRENGARMMLHCPRDGKLVLRLEYDGGPLDSGYILEYYNLWMTTESCVESTILWLEKIKKL
jgi:hypothetical protein